METNTRKTGTGLWKKLLLAALCLLLAALIAIGVMFGNSLRTLMGIERVGQTDLFTMEYIGDYGFDEFLQTGASTDLELVEFVSRQLLKGLPVSIDMPDLGCSTFAASLESGERVFGRNFDMYYSPALFVTTRPDNGYASISMVNLSYIGFGEDKLPTSLTNSLMALAAPYAPMDGINEKGLAAGVLQIDTDPTNQQTDKVDITTSTAIRLMLDKAATVEEALVLLQSYDMHSSANSCYHFHIADANGASVIVEYIDDEMSIIEGTAATNFLLTPGDYDFGKGQDRYDILTEALAENGGVFDGHKHAMGLLESVSQKPQEGKTSTTQWSCVYDLTNPSVLISVGMDYENLYPFSLN